MTRTEAFSNCINKEFIKILILIIEPKLTLLMINTKDVFHTPRQQAHFTRAISRVTLPRMTACTVALEQIWNDFRVNLAVAFEILRTVVLPERFGPFSFNPPIGRTFPVKVSSPVIAIS